jgi:hypothetical protein
MITLATAKSADAVALARSKSATTCSWIARKRVRIVSSMTLLDLNQANGSISLNQICKTLFVHDASNSFISASLHFLASTKLFAEQCFEFDEKADVLKFCPISVTLNSGRGEQHDRIAEEGTLPYGSSVEVNPS